MKQSFIVNCLKVDVVTKITYYVDCGYHNNKVESIVIKYY